MSEGKKNNPFRREEKLSATVTPALKKRIAQDLYYIQGMNPYQVYTESSLVNKIVAMYYNNYDFFWLVDRIPLQYKTVLAEELRKEFGSHITAKQLSKLSKRDEYGLSILNSEETKAMYDTEIKQQDDLRGKQDKDLTNNTK
jgi:hypothetical protein